MKPGISASVGTPSGVATNPPALIPIRALISITVLLTPGREPQRPAGRAVTGWSEPLAGSRHEQAPDTIADRAE
jgi:hypothetical protein